MSNARNLSKLKPSSSGLIEIDDVDSSVTQKFSFRNRIINGDMRIDQRNAGASVTPTNSQYLLDRFYALLTQASKFTVQQNAGSVTPPVGFKNYLGVTSSSAYSVVSTDIFAIAQGIEGFNIADLNWGTANAATVTLSFKVYSSLTGTFGGSLRNTANTRAYPFSYTVSSANTWTSVSVTVPGDTTGTWATDNTAGIYLSFGLGVGSTYSATAGSWTGTASIFSAIGATSVVGTSGATFYITGVQLEKGTTATSFEYRDYGRELQMCQRYYEVFGTGGVGGTSTNPAAQAMGWMFQVNKRAAPTITHLTNYTVIQPGVNIYTITATAGTYVSISGTTCTMTSSTTPGSVSSSILYASGTNTLSASAEL